MKYELETRDKGHPLGKSLQMENHVKVDVERIRPIMVIVALLPLKQRSFLCPDCTVSKAQLVYVALTLQHDRGFPILHIICPVLTSAVPGTVVGACPGMQ